MSKRPSRTGSVLGSMALLAGSLLLCFLIGEAGLRAAGHGGAPVAPLAHTYLVDDPILDWRTIPHAEYRTGSVVYRYNSRGFRDVEHEPGKVSGKKRIVVIGDSVTDGYGVEFEAVFARRLQASLGKDVDVINIAAGGLNTPQVVHLFAENGLEYQPDLVVLNFVLNDGDFYSSLGEARRYNAAKDSEIGLLNVPINLEVKRVLKSSALIYFVKERVEDLKGRMLGEEDTGYFETIWSRAENREKVSLGFERLRELSQRRAFDVVVLIWPLVTDYEAYGFGSVHDWVRVEAERRELAAVDLLPSFAEHSYRDLQVTAEDNVHPNALGHTIAVESFLRWYREGHSPEAKTDA